MTKWLPNENLQMPGLLSSYLPLSRWNAEHSHRVWRTMPFNAEYLLGNELMDMQILETGVDQR